MADLNRMDPDGLTPLELLEHRGFHCLRVWMKARTLLVDKGARRTDGICDEGAVREKCQFKTCGGKNNLVGEDYCLFGEIAPRRRGWRRWFRRHVKI
jgi:hypothetical protein